MIEIIALAAAALLTVALAAFAWVSKKRIDDLERAFCLLSKRVTVLYQAQKHGSKAILRKTEES